MGTSSVTASPIHKIGLPDHERVTISATDKHATNANHQDGLDTVRRGKKPRSGGIDIE